MAPRRQGGAAHPLRPGHPRALGAAIVARRSRRGFFVARKQCEDAMAGRLARRRAGRARQRGARAPRISPMRSSPTSRPMPRIWAATIPAPTRSPCSGSRAISRRSARHVGSGLRRLRQGRQARSRTATLCAKRIAASLNLTLGIDPVFKVKQDEGDPWAAITRADVLFLTSDKPTRVENEYRKALARVRERPILHLRRAPEHRDVRGARLARRATWRRRSASSTRRSPRPEKCRRRRSGWRGSCSSPATWSTGPIGRRRRRGSRGPRRRRRRRAP